MPDVKNWAYGVFWIKGTAPLVVHRFGARIFPRKEVKNDAVGGIESNCCQK